LDQPHTADVRTLKQSEFYIADAQAMLAGDQSRPLRRRGPCAAPRRRQPIDYRG
jgi:hypothetical protein